MKKNVTKFRPVSSSVNLYKKCTSELKNILDYGPNYMTTVGGSKHFQSKRKCYCAFENMELILIKITDTE